MLEEFQGVPVHPLLVHLPVVFVPLLAILAAGYALAPFVRPHIRWVLGILAVVTPISALLATLSGDAFFDRLDSRGAITEGFYPRIEDHQGYGDLTLYSSIALGVVTLALVYVVGPRGARPTDSAAWARVLPWVLGALSLVAAGVSLYFVIRTGDSGAKNVWEGS